MPKKPVRLFQFVHQKMKLKNLDKSLEYQHNEYLFDLEINKQYVMVARTETRLPTDKSSKFMIRIIGRGVTTEEREQEISLIK